MPVKTTQKSSFSARDASSCTITRAAEVLLLYVDDGLPKSDGDTLRWLVWGRLAVLVGVRGEESANGIASRLLWAVVGEDKAGLVTGGAGGVGYGLEPKETATSAGRRPVFANPSQAM
jgi:hypothetical protein